MASLRRYKVRLTTIANTVSGAYSIIYAVRGDEVVVLHFYGNAMDINSRLNDPGNLFGE